MKWVRFLITTKTEAVEAITYGISDIGIASVEIDDPKDITMQKKNKTDWDYIDEELLNNKNVEEVVIKAYLPEDAPYEEKLIQIQEKLNGINEFLDIGVGTVEIETLDEEEWANSWKKYYKPIKIGQNIIIKPSWETYNNDNNGEIMIEMDPGMAFGTGTHETTSMCIELIEKLIHKEDYIFDIGCGSGILGIAAAKLGASGVTAVDLDVNAVKVARENVKLNSVEDIVNVYEGNLLDVVNQNSVKGNIVVANIIADVIIELSSVVPKFLIDSGVFIASGIIKERLEEVKNAIIKNNFEIMKINTKGEWCAIAAQKNK